MAMEQLLQRYGWKWQAGERLFGDRLSLSKVSTVLITLLLSLLVVTVSFSWPSLATGRVSVGDSIRTGSRNTIGAERTVGRRLLGVPPGLHEQKKREAMEKLEDVLLEPPRAASERSRTYQRRTKYLSDLMGEDSLKSYARRVFIDVGLQEGDGAGWLGRTYPTKGLDFDKYELEANVEDGGMTEWMRERVKEEEFVVMKAEAEDVEELMKSKAIRLVDELFLECRTKNNNATTKKKKKKAYWECLALYGKLRDQGVAVHQWWG